MLLCTSCFEAELSPAQDDSLCRYVSVGMSIAQSGEDSKSVITSQAEDFHGAVLYALNPSTGRILSYGSNAGELSGTPVWISTRSRYFSWPLPEKTTMKIYCLVNPPEGFEDEIVAASVTERLLKNKYFNCEGHSGLEALESSGTGMPLTGVKNVDAGEITTDDAFLSISVEHLFAKYSFSLDLSGLEEGETLSVNKLAVNNGNTRVPYFTSGYKQTDSSYLTDSDYASESQLSRLSKGGQGNSVDIYVLENCHGTHDGATSWWTVHKDLNQSWPEVSQCTFIQLSYSITGKDGDINSYMSRIYLGEGNMVSDFNVRRNLYKSICIRIGRRTGESDPCFQFGEDTFYIGPGSIKQINYDSNIYSLTGDYTVPDIWVTELSGLPTDDINVISHDASSGEAIIRASSSCVEGSFYWINGGCRSPFFWPPYGSEASAFVQRRKLAVVRSRTITFDSPSGSLYPYQKADYVSLERYTRGIAEEMAQSLQIKAVQGSVDHQLTEIGVIEIDGEYAVKVTLVPDRPGQIGFSAEYGTQGTPASGSMVSVMEPVLAALSSSVPNDSYHVDVLGNSVAIDWRLLAQDGTPLENPVSGTVFSVTKNDSSGTGLTVRVTGYGEGQYSSTTAYTSVRVDSFAGLHGFDEDNYTFSGTGVEATGTFIYRNGYSVSKTVRIVLDNPLAGYSYDGKVYEYALRQGRTLQADYVSVTHPEYTLEYMLTWPQREFSVDLTRGGTRACQGLEVWTDHSSITSLDQFAPESGFISGINENMNQWGPVYYGKRLTNIVSGEKKTFLHSVIRVYCHYNVFASFDVQEKNKVKVNWDDPGSINWNPTLMLTNYHFGCFTAGMKANFQSGSYFYEMIPLLQIDISSSTRVKPVLDGFNLDTGGRLLAHGTYSSGVHDTYQAYSYGLRSYLLGYWERPSDIDKYDIYYDWLYFDGVDDSIDRITWRLIAANNRPWFKMGSGDYVVNGKYVTHVQKNARGEYCFNIIPNGDDMRDYSDSEGYGYQRIALFWEGREGRVMTGSRILHPLTSYDADLCLVNGWYDPTPYTNGLPILANKTGMYFFPESESSNTRSGYPPYYIDDWPYSLGTSHGSMEIGLFSHLQFGDLLQRDRDAAR